MDMRGMMQVQLRSKIDEPWLSMEPIRVGSVPRSLGTPDTYVTVVNGTEPVLRIDVYGDSNEAFPFSDALVWREWIAIGFGHRLYLVRLSDRATSSLNLEGYFGHMYCGELYLLVASGSRLFRLEPDGTVLWKSERLGIDGVVVTDLNNATIKGEGEWDPPEGWKPFTIEAKNGQRIHID